MASRAILSNFFEEQLTQNLLKYLSGLSRALFPPTFLEIVVNSVADRKLIRELYWTNAAESPNQGIAYPTYIAFVILRAGWLATGYDDALLAGTPSKSYKIQCGFLFSVICS